MHLQVLQNAAKHKRKPENGHDAFADLDDEPIPRPKKPKEATDFDVVGEVLNNLRPPGPPLKQLKMKFNQVRSVYAVHLNGSTSHDNRDACAVRAELLLCHAHASLAD